MKMKRGITILTLLAAMTLSMVAQAQPGWNWPEEEKAKAEEYNVLYSDAVKMQDWQTAIPPLQWLINKAPDLNKSLYVNGAKIYDNLAKVEKDPEKKVVYVDSLMLMYDMRMKYFQDSVNVMNRKVFKAYRYYIKDYAKSVWLLDIFDKTYEISGDDVMTQNLLAYMNVIKVNKLVKKNLTDEQILERYDVISDVVEKKRNALIAKKKSTDRIDQQKDYVDKILTEIVNFDCDLIAENMGPRFKANPDDITLVKRMFSFMLNGKCTDSDLFLEVSKQLQSLEPNYGLAKVIGNKCLIAGNYGCASQYFNEALTLTDDGAEKAEIYIAMGKMESKRNNKPAARANYRKALAADAGNTEPYLLIGDLYYHSYEECKKLENQVDDRLVFIAAYEMYQRAGNAAKMRSAKSQFPSTEEIFTANFEKGQVMTVGCWINESVKLDSRD